MRACSGAEDQPANLEIFENYEAAFIGKYSTKLSLDKVERIVNYPKYEKLITIEMQKSEGIAFYANNDTDHIKWMTSCNFLVKMPNHGIPAEPNYNLVPEEIIERFSDPRRFNAGKVLNAFDTCVFKWLLS